ncbi:hypothetical protein L1049_011122 [Liquidambar formosana]|uniref:Uncharacterized protein n=1 Tax=Liquidambar formosana TaxID=63359 RepID=A0AAP0RQP6_LIQFO
MAVSDVEAVLEFLRKNGFSEAESALREDMVEKSTTEVGDGFDFETFFFPMVPPPPPVRIPSTRRKSEGLIDGGDCSRSSSEEFVSLDSSTTDVCSSEFTNPYGIHSTNRGNSVASSDRLSEFGTARDYNDFDMQNDLYWYDEKDEGHYMTPCFRGSDSFGCPSEDKFVMTLETERQCENPFSLNHKSEGFQSAGTNYLDKPCVFNISSTVDINKVPAIDYYHLDKSIHLEGGVERESESCGVYSCSAPHCKCCAGAGGFYGQDPVDYSHLSLKESDLKDVRLKFVGEVPTDSYSEDRINKSSKYSNKSSPVDLVGEFKNTSDLHLQVAEKDFQPNGNDSYEVGDGRELIGVIP